MTGPLVPPLPNEITPGEAASIAGVTAKTIREWAEQIDHLGVKRVGRWRINRRNLQFILAHGLERYLERVAALKARKNETNETHETHLSHRFRDNGTDAHIFGKDEHV